MGVAGILALPCLASGQAVAMAAQCKAFRLDVPDPATLKLRDGEHIGFVLDLTPHGKEKTDEAHQHSRVEGDCHR
jgi:hypothetical protein